MAASPAAAQDNAEAPAPVAEERPPYFQKSVDMTGYVSSRTTYQRARVGGLLPTADVPQWGELLELNGQLKASYTKGAFVFADVSLVAQFVGDFRSTDASGAETHVAPHDVASFRPLVSLNELYVLHEVVPAFNVLIGKKRLVWGPGQAFNPTDILNVRKDPTDPTFQRAGAWMARLEVPLESLTFTALFSPQVTSQFNGIPSAMLLYPEWDRRDTQAHYLLAGRVYALVADTDVNALVYFSNRYNDDFEKKLRFGMTFSRIFFKYWELHAEALFQAGSARSYVNGECVGSVPEAIGCVSAMPMKPVVEQSRLSSAALYPQVLAGVRPQFDDDSFLSVEYLYQSDGYTKSDYQNLVNAFDLISQANAAGLPTSRITGASSLFGAPNADGTPNRFSFAPTARHYLFVTYNKPRIFDDFTAQLTVIANLQDLSTLWSPSVAWSVSDNFNLNLLGFFGLPGPDALAARVPSTNKPATEYGLMPTVARVMLEARLYY